MTNFKVQATAILIVALSSTLSISSVMAASPTLDKIKSTGKLTFGYRESSVPFSYLGGDQKPVGISIDLCGVIAEKIKAATQNPKLEVAYVPVNASNRMPLLQNGTIDIECGSTTNTAERQKQVAFTVATYVTSPRWLVSSSSSIKDVSGLKGQTIVYTQGSANAPQAEAIISEKKLNATVAQGKDQAESLLVLSTGRAVAWFEDDILQAGLVANAPDPKAFRFLPETYSLAYYGLMLPKDDVEFKALVDGVIKNEMSSGAFEKSYAKWFNSPIPPKGLNLSLPMSDPMKARIANPSDTLTP